MSENVMPMAWNQPGSNGKKRSEGPPDLDQVFKNLVDKFKQLFGMKPAGPSSGKPNTEFLATLIIGILVFIYLVSGFYTVSAYEQGVITRFGKYSHTVNPGLHWLAHFVDKVQRVNTETLKSSRHSGWMLTKDENIVLVEMEVQYRVLDAEKYLFTVAMPDTVLAQAADSALRQVIGDSLTDDVLTDKKQQIAEAIKEQLISTLNSYDAGFHVEAVNFRDSRPPEPVKDAFDDVTKSREDRERLKLQAEAYSNTIIPEAEGAAKKILSEAEAYKESVTLDAVGETERFDLILPGYQKAPQVTKTRMYLDSMGEVLSKTTKVVASNNGANNLVYLPLDKMLNNTRSEANVLSTSSEPGKAAPATKTNIASVEGMKNE